MSTEVPGRTATHALDPLSADENRRASRLARDSDELSGELRFVSIALREPPKDATLEFEASGTPTDREAFLVVRDRTSRATYEVVVSLTHEALVSCEHKPEAQHALTEEDFLGVEETVKADPRWQEAMRKRGVTDFEHVMVDPWPSGYTGPGDEPSRRLNRPLTFVRTSEDDNGYARPVENLIVFFDLDEMQVIDIEDHGVVPLPTQPGNYTAEGIQDPENVPHFRDVRRDLTP